MKFSRPCDLLPLAVFIVTLPAHGGVIFNNLGGGDTFGGAAFGFAPNLYTGDGFVIPTGQNYTLDSIEMALSTQISLSGTGTNIVVTNTAADGKPGAILESFLTGTIPPRSTPEILTVTSSLHPLLIGGQQYFVILGGGPGAGWFYQNSIGDLGPTVAAFTANPSQYGLITGPRSAFRVDGSAAAGVPEPGTQFLLLAGITFVILNRRLWP